MANRPPVKMFVRAGGASFPAPSTHSASSEPAAKAPKSSRFARQQAAKPKVKNYFDEEDEEDGVVEQESRPAASDEVDPLDAFMDANSTVVAEQNKSMGVEKTKAARLDEEVPDEIDAVLDYYDSDGNLIDDEEDEGNGEDGEKRAIEALPPVDHASIVYEPFRKNFYTPHHDIASMSAQAVDELAAEMDLVIKGDEAPWPIRSFRHAGFQDSLVKAIIKQGYEAPTPVQSAALPVAMSGRDLLGLAQTGSGKTLAFVWPMVVHVSDQRPLAKGEGPIGVVLAPTRELVEQIHKEIAKFLKPYRSVAIVGGAGKYEMVVALKEGREVVVATPGRFMELLSKKATNLRRTTMVVLDEADRMFEMGFEYQMRSIMEQIRPDRQTLLFSATFKRHVESLASQTLVRPVRIQVGAAGASNADVKQEFVVLREDSDKWAWLSSTLPGLLQCGKVLIFVSQKAAAESLALSLRALASSGFAVCSLHGDMDQADRSAAVRLFKAEQTSVMVATDVAARGLDVRGISHVVNYDAARSIESHVHRIGRTGRMGVDGVVPGTAHTLLTRRDSAFASQLMSNLRVSEQPVPPCLHDLASSSSGKGGSGKGKGGGFGKGHGSSSSGGNRQDRGSGSFTSQAAPTRVASPYAPGFSAATSSSQQAATTGMAPQTEPEALGSGFKKRSRWDNQ